MQTTVINQQLNMERVTHLNPLLRHSAVTQINPDLLDQVHLQNGNLIENRYLLGEKLNEVGGEADLFFCTDTQGDPDSTFIAKLYRRNAALNTGVFDIIAGLDCPFIGKFHSYGEWNGRFYEIIPYFSQGSLQGQRFSYDELRNIIIPALNTALHTLHTAGIIHKDLKPSNIMRTDTGSIAVIDFGISGAVADGLTMLVDKTGMTLAYSAPETFRNIFLRESDYYSLGITIFELFTGKLPYAGISGADLERLVAVQKIPLPQDMPDALQDLITGLTYGDISNRRDKANPNRRWTYEEVARWLEGEKQPIPGKSGSLMEKRPYVFLDQYYDDPESLVDALAMNWEAGKNALFSGSLSVHFSRISDTIAEICRNAEEEAASVSGQDDIIFWKMIYQLVPEYRQLYWKGKRWENLPALGRDILSKNQDPSSPTRDLAREMLEQGILKLYIQMFDGDVFSKQIQILSDISKLYWQDCSQPQAQTKYILYLGHLLSGQIALNIDGKSFYNIPQLKNHMDELCDISFDALQKFCHKLLDHQHGLTPQFEAWLLALGKGQSIREWKYERGNIYEEDIV